MGSRAQGLESVVLIVGLMVHGLGFSGSVSSFGITGQNLASTGVAV